MSPAAWGSLLCFLSAVGYTATNICLRRLAALGTDPMWTTAMKETVAVVVLGPWMVVQTLRGRGFFPSVGWIGLVVISAATAQFAGNILQQWAFGVVGLAIAVPSIMAVSLTGGALLAWLFLGETVPLRTLVALGLLIGAIGVLSFGALGANISEQEILAETPFSPSCPTVSEPPNWGTASLESTEKPDGAPLAKNTSPSNQDQKEMGSSALTFLPKMAHGRILLGIGAGCVAGAAFAQLGLMLRVTSSRGISPLAVVLMVTSVGAVSLGLISLGRLGPSLVANTTPEQWAYMAGAGLCNLLAFLAITTGLRWTKLVRANLLNAAQVAMGAVAGILLFGEPWNQAVATGVLLTLLGLLLIGSPEQPEQERSPSSAHSICQCQIGGKPGASPL